MDLAGRRSFRHRDSSHRGHRWGTGPQGTTTTAVPSRCGPRAPPGAGRFRLRHSGDMEHRHRKPRRPAALGPPLGLSADFSPALSLGLPTSCAGCGRWETALCPQCRELLEAAPFAVEHADAADDLDIWALASYTGPVRTMVLGWKNGAREDLSEVMARSGRHLGRRWAQAHPPTEVWTGSTGDTRVLVVVPAPSGIVRRLRGRLVAATWPTPSPGGSARSGPGKNPQCSC
ncbi:hypothetical protein HMPREF0059_00431 [Actinomyces viscosus C505]|uniref:Phosphoribosyltransferase n=2 Tax=Actinomyces viscosus TaxID=1656 RepID=F2UVI0_ACTVI|nr:hypothetical protein HMPREF0059_00431 [Actinomyces viscosus C505]